MYLSLVIYCPEFEIAPLIVPCINCFCVNMLPKAGDPVGPEFSIIVHMFLCGCLRARIFPVHIQAICLKPLCVHCRGGLDWENELVNMFINISLFS